MVLQPVKSDSDCHGSSESDSQRENVALAGQKNAAASSRPDSAVEDECSDRDDVTRDVQNLSLGCPGTLKTSADDGSLNSDLHLCGLEKSDVFI